VRAFLVQYLRAARYLADPKNRAEYIRLAVKGGLDEAVAKADLGAWPIKKVIDLVLDKMGVDPRIGVPLAAAALVLIAVTGSYRRWERTVVFLCLLDFVWFALAYGLRPPMGQIVRGTLAPSMPAGGLTPDLMFLVIAIVGTTIAPWQLFFQQSCIADKRLRFADVKWARLDTLMGACITITVAGCMMIAGHASRVHGFTFTDPAQMAVDIGSFTSGFFKNAILLLMINAAVLGTTAISLSSAWAYGEVRGWPHSLQLPVRKAPTRSFSNCKRKSTRCSSKSRTFTTHRGKWWENPAAPAGPGR